MYWKWNNTLWKNVNSCWNIKITFYLETSGGQNSNLYLNAVQFFNTRAIYTSVAAQDSCFTAEETNPIIYFYLILLNKMEKMAQPESKCLLSVGWGKNRTGFSGTFRTTEK